MDLFEQINAAQWAGHDVSPYFARTLRADPVTLAEMTQ